MPPNRLIAQSYWQGTNLLARSPSFSPLFEEQASAILARFLEGAVDTASPEGVFAYPLGKRHLVIASFAATARSQQQRFRLLVLERQLYRYLHDPFAIAQRYPTDWASQGPLEDLEWPLEVLPDRTVHQLHAILAKGVGPTLLPAAQVLADGGKVAMLNEEPTIALVQDLWSLLPHRIRSTIWPTSFAYGTQLPFDLILLRADYQGSLEGYMTESQLQAYPDGRYEHGLQIAIESLNERSLRDLLNRKSPHDVVRLAVALIVGLVVLTVASRIAAKLL